MKRLKRGWLLKTLVFGLCLVGGFDGVSAESYAVWEKVLAEYVDEEGQVDYAGLKKNPSGLNAYVDNLAYWGPQKTPQFFKTRADSFAFWLNGYNALVVQGVIENYPVRSVTDVLPEFGFFKKKTYQIDGQKLTLDEIEHTILRTQFKDPRIHAAINCAAVSCPKLARKPFTGAGLEQQLERRMRQMVLNPKHVYLDSSTKTVYLSQIFAWFESDFTEWPAKDSAQKSGSLLNYISSFLPDVQRQFLLNTPNIKIVFNAYDWSLNDQSVPK